MHKKRTILEFQNKNTIVFKDDFIFQLMLQNPERQKKYCEIEKKSNKTLLRIGFEELCKDIFYSYYNKRIILISSKYIRLPFLLNHMIIEKLIDCEQHKVFRTGIWSTVQERETSFQSMIVTILFLIKNIETQFINSTNNKGVFLFDSMMKTEHNSSTYNKVYTENKKKENNIARILFNK